MNGAADIPATVGLLQMHPASSNKEGATLEVSSPDLQRATMTAPYPHMRLGIHRHAPTLGISSPVPELWHHSPLD